MKRNTLSIVIVFVVVLLFHVVFFVSGCGGGGSGGSGGGGGGSPTPEPTDELQEVRISPESPSLSAGRGLQLTVTGIRSDETTIDLTQKVTYTTSDDEVVSVEKNGFVTGNMPGVATIIAEEPLSGKIDTVTVTVTEATMVSITVNPRENKIPRGLTCTFTVIGNFSDGTRRNVSNKVEWESSNPAVAIVDNEAETPGTFLGVRKGRAKITASLDEKYAEATLEVTDAELISIEIQPRDVELPKGATEQFTAQGVYTDGTRCDLTSFVEWDSSNLYVLTISNKLGKKGLASAWEEGTVQVRATHPQLGIFDVTTVTVAEAELVELEIVPDTPTVTIDSQIQFTAIGHYSDDTEKDLTRYVTWKSSRETVATISNKSGVEGIATAYEEGETIIRATYYGTEVYGETHLTVIPDEEP